MTSALEAALWPLSRLPDAMEILARAAGLEVRALRLPTGADGAAALDGTAFERWVDYVAAHLGIGAEPHSAAYADVPKLVRDSAPGIFRLPAPLRDRFVVVARTQRQRVVLIGPDLLARTVPLDELRAALCAHLESLVAGSIQVLLDTGDVAPAARGRVREALMRERLSAERVGDCWMLCVAPGSPFLAQLRYVRVPWQIAGLLALRLVQFVLSGIGAWVIGRGALEGRIDEGWLLAWALLLLTSVPLGVYSARVSGGMTIRIAGLMRRRLLEGVLRLDPDEIRGEGVGMLLARVFESESVQGLVIGGGLGAALSVFDVVAAGFVLAAGAGGVVHVALLALWCGLAAVMSRRFYRDLQRWTDERLSVTHGLTEQMVGHQTRLVQQPPERWHVGEDEALERYLSASIAMDTTSIRIASLLPRGWTLVGVAALAPTLAAGDASPARLVIACSGVLLANRALRALLGGLGDMAGAAVAWERVGGLFKAAARPQSLGMPAVALATQPRDEDSEVPVLEARELTYRHKGRAAPVLRGVDLRLAAGDRVLLEGPSGGGKSTLGAVLAGLRTPESGLLLVDGQDIQLLGLAGWRRKVVSAPQFHENHVFSSSLAFNLLMGRRWPADRKDMAEAAVVCRALGLMDVIVRMPNRLQQMVGETGWQLSHGERSRVFVARALLQGAEVIILDESLGALDPETHAEVMQGVLERAPTLILIAHP